MHVWLKGALAAGSIGVSAVAGYAVAARRAPPPEVKVVTVYRDVPVALPAPPPPPSPSERIEDLDVPAVVEAKRFRLPRLAAPDAPPGATAPDVEPSSPFAGLSEAIPLGNTGADALVSRALAAAERGDYPRAWRSLDKALKRDPDHAIGHLLAGVLSQMQGDLRRARQEYGEFLLREPLGPRSAEVRKVLAATAGAPRPGQRPVVAQR